MKYGLLLTRYFVYQIFLHTKKMNKQVNITFCSLDSFYKGIIEKNLKLNYAPETTSIMQQKTTDWLITFDNFMTYLQSNIYKIIGKLRLKNYSI